jgi:hypothetical protein
VSDVVDVSDKGTWMRQGDNVRVIKLIDLHSSAALVSRTECPFISYLIASERRRRMMRS